MSQELNTYEESVQSILTDLNSAFNKTNDQEAKSILTQHHSDMIVLKSRIAEALHVAKNIATRLNMESLKEY